MISSEETVHDIQLSDEETTAILDLLDSQAHDLAEGRRRSKRLSLRGMAMVVTLDDPDHPAVYRVRMRNASQHGVAFLINRPMSEGRLVRFHVPLDDNGKTSIKEAVVRHCRHVQKMIYEVGAEFGAAGSPHPRAETPKVRF